LILLRQSGPCALAITVARSSLGFDQVEPGAGAQAILDGRSRSQTFLDGWTGARYLGSGSTDRVCGTSELYKYYNGL